MSVSLVPFIEFVETLHQHGLSKDADRLNSLLNAAWTSSSEFVGELGLEVQRIQQSHSTPSDNLKAAIAKCIKEVEIVWPGLVNR